jgi:hypothetical protein
MTPVFISFIVPLLVFAVFFLLLKPGFKKATSIFALMDKKITEFKEKKFSSDQEKDAAKQLLKNELMQMKDSLHGISPTSTIGLRQKAMSKIMEIL